MNLCLVNLIEQDLVINHRHLKQVVWRYLINSYYSFAFYCPDEEIYVVGTLNQVTDPSVQYRLMNQLIDSIVN